VADEIEEFLTGSRPEIEPDRVLSTVLFTDIVDSTRRANELGDRAWRALLDRHDTLVRREIAHFRGREIKTTGDGFLATFDGPARAVRCGEAIAAGVGTSGWPCGSACIRARSSSGARISAASPYTSPRA
jgi:class 3 adenylate cyclase